MADDFEKLVNKCTILSTEIIHNLERISSSQKQDEIDESNVDASRKLESFKQTLGDIENTLVPGKSTCFVLFVFFRFTVLE